MTADSCFCYKQKPNKQKLSFYVVCTRWKLKNVMSVFMYVSRLWVRALSRLKTFYTLLYKKLMSVLNS